MDLDDEMVITVTVQSKLAGYTEDSSQATPTSKAKFTISISKPKVDNKKAGSGSSSPSPPSKLSPYFEYVLDT